MYSTKSFCNVLALASNDPGVNSRIGELTTYAKTYTKEMGQYHSAALDGYDLYNFSSINNGVREKMAFALVDKTIALVNYLVQQTLSTPGELFVDQLLNGIAGTANGVNALSVQLGPMVQDGAHWLPSWISFADGADARPNVHKVWLAVDAFLHQYTDYEIVVVPPLTPLDDFFLPGSMVETRLKAITPTQMMEQAQVVRDGKPETLYRTDPYTYHDVMNSSRRIDVYWTVLIYGGAGNNPDLIREALQNYILANSTKTRAQWTQIFPDIFRRTEHIIAPYWEQFAQGARVLQHGVYSPIVKTNAVVQRLTTLLPDYAAAHIANYVETFGFPYRSIACSVIGHLENRDSKFRLSQQFPDFMNVGTDSTDFGRMSLRTQQWALSLGEMIILAEEWTTATDLPHGTSRVIRNGQNYISRTFDRIQFLVLTKESAHARFGITEPPAQGV